MWKTIFKPVVHKAWVAEKKGTAVNAVVTEQSQTEHKAAEAAAAPKKKTTKSKGK